MTQTGFIPLHREYFQSWLYTEAREFSKYEAFVDLCQRAAFTPRKEMVDSVLYSLDYGELVASQRFLMVAWGWRSKSKVEKFLKTLQSAGEIEVDVLQKISHITVCKLACYYRVKASERPVKSQSEASEKPVKSQSEAKEEERKKEKEGKKETTTPFGAVAVGKELILSFFENLRSDEIFIEHCIREYKINADRYHQLLNDFYRQTKALDTLTARKYQELKQHYFNWLRKRLNRKNATPNHGQGIQYPNSIKLKIQ